MEGRDDDIIKTKGIDTGMIDMYVINEGNDDVLLYLVRR